MSKAIQSNLQKIYEREVRKRSLPPNKPIETPIPALTDGSRSIEGPITSKKQVS